MLKIYRSSAGSGKTFTLVKEFLRICIQSKDVGKFKHILAITFTNKAANEMKERVLHTLEDFSVGGSKESNMMEMLVKETGISKENIVDFAKVMLASILQDYSSLSIKTIDSFIQMVLRNFSYELELPRNFEVQLDRDTLLDAMVENLMNEINGEENNVLAQALVQFAEEKMEEGKGWRIEQNISTFASKMMEEDSLPYLLQLKNIDYEQIEETKKRLLTIKREFENKINEFGQKAKKIIKENELDESAFYQTRNGISGYFTRLVNFPDSEIEYKNNTEKTLNEDKWTSGGASDIDKSKIDSIKHELRKIAENAQRLKVEKYADYALADLVLRNMYIYKIADGLYRALEKFKEDENVLPIQESQPLISQIVSQQDAPIIYERIGEKYDSILIDEFQDTSLLQFRNLLPLIENSQYKSEDSLIVGDAKQSIYRFKGGEAEQLMKLPYILGSDDNLILKEREVAINNYPTQLLSLNQNFRSHTNIIEFNNQFYDSLKKLSPSLTAIYQQHEQILNPKKTGGYVSIEAIKKSEDDEDEKLNRIMAIIEEAKEANYVLGDIAILVRGNKRGSQIAAFLLENGYTVETNESLYFTESNEVRLLLAAMHFIAKPFDHIIRYELLSNLGIVTLITFEKTNTLLKTDIPAFLTAIAESKGIYFDFNNLRNLSTSMLLDKLVVLFDLDVSDIFVASFLDLISENNKHFKNGLAEFFEWWEIEKEKKSIDNTSGTNAVKISTIHKSKGLQYPIVIMPDADWNIHSNNEYHWIEKDESIGISPILINHVKKLEETKYAPLYHNRMEKQLADAMNLLYVATTRAEDRLYVLYEEKESKGITHVSDFIIHFKGDVENYILGEKSKKVASIKKESKSISTLNLSERFIKCEQSPALSIHTKSFDSKEIAYGNTLHELLLLATQSSIDFAIKAINRHPLTAEDRAKLKEDILYICTHDLLKDIYSGAYILVGESEVKENNDKIQKPDLIAINKTSKNITIIDYKTGKANQEHIAQISNYAMLLEETGRVIDKKYIVYTQSKEVVSV